MKSALFTLILAGCGVGALAQTVLPPPAELPKRAVTLKLGVTSLLGPDATVSAGVELPVGAYKAWQIEGGYGWFNSLFNADRARYEHSSVVQVRTEFRWYGYGYMPKGFVSRSIGPYYAVELAGKQINVRDQATVGRNCVGFSCGYFERIDQPVTRYTLTGFIKTGWQLAFDNRAKDPRFVADLYVGIGAGYAWTTRTPLTPNGSSGTDVYYNEPRFLEPRDRFDGSRYSASLDFIVGTKLGYRLKTH